MRRFAPLCALLACLAACGGDSKQTLEKVASAAATASLAAAELRAHHTSSRYTASTLATLDDDVAQDVSSLEPEKLPESLRSRAFVAASAAKRAVSAMASAARRGDTLGIARAAAGADAAKRDVDAVIARLPDGGAR